jgi:hypothetical protein
MEPQVNTSIFTENAKDSLLHAFDHFFELGHGSDRKWHHQKWIIVSTHHAASCLVYAWLKEADKNNPCFKKNGNVSFPHLEESIKALLEFKDTPFLTSAEAVLLKIFKRLNSIRNEIIHRAPPVQFDKAVLAFAATSIIGMFHIVSKRSNKSFEEIFNEFPENRTQVFETIHYLRVEEYYKLVDQLLEEQYPDSLRSFCPACATRSIISGHCEACFEDVNEVTCPSCGENVNILDKYPFEQTCSECESKIDRVSDVD